MIKNAESEILENSSPNIETHAQKFDMLDKREILLGVVESLIRTDKLEEGLQRMFHFLKKYLPLTVKNRP